MNERDTETFARFASRLALIEAEIKNPPPRDTSDRVRAVVRPIPGRRVPGLAALVVVGVIAVLAPLIAGQPLATPGSTVPGDAGNSSALPVRTPSPGPSETTPLPLDPASPPEEPTGPCLNHVTTYDRLITTIEQDADTSSAVIVGTVAGIGKAQWNTVDGRIPANDDLEASRVLRLLRVDVETIARGTVPASVTLWVPGGVIGCHGFSTGGFADLQVGSRYVFFLNGSPPRTRLEQARLGPIPGAWQVWSIEGDQVGTSFDGPLPLTTVIERARGG